MGEEKRRNKKAVIFVVTFLVVNLLALSLITMWESVSVNRRLTAHAEEIGDGFDEVMDSYEQSFKLFAQMMGREIQNNPNPDILWDYLKSIDAPLDVYKRQTCRDQKGENAVDRHGKAAHGQAAFKGVIHYPGVDVYKRQLQ